MPKNSSLDVLRRWREMDEHLARGRLFVASFARRWKVSPKTVRRDLAAFQEIGQRMAKGFEQELSEFYWAHESGVKRLFTK